MRGKTKLALIFVLFVAVIQTNEVDANVRRECRKMTGVSWASLKKLKRGEFGNVDPKLKCYIKCFMVKNGVISDNNEIEIEKTLRHLPRKLQDGSRVVLGKCKDMRGNDSCDTAFQIAKCYFQDYPEVLQKVNLV